MDLNAKGESFSGGGEVSRDAVGCREVWWDAGWGEMPRGIMVHFVGWCELA